MPKVYKRPPGRGADRPHQVTENVLIQVGQAFGQDITREDLLTVIVHTAGVSGRARRKMERAFSLHAIAFTPTRVTVSEPAAFVIAARDAESAAAEAVAFADRKPSDRKRQEAAQEAFRRAEEAAERMERALRDGAVETVLAYRLSGLSGHVYAMIQRFAFVDYHAEMSGRAPQGATGSGGVTGGRAKAPTPYRAGGLTQSQERADRERATVAREQAADDRVADTGAERWGRATPRPNIPQRKR